MTAAPTEKAGAELRVNKASQRKAVRRRQINIKSFTSLPTVYDFLNGTENINNYINIMETWK